ncbi:MAG: ABC transporter permease [Actinomycetia bacterium]|nr:ABC transporter permease [Actinomycetes bacterium]
MFSSSRAESPDESGRLAAPHLQSDELEELDRSEIRTVEAALGTKSKAAPRHGLLTAELAAPGSLWLLFFLVVPVVFIVLTSFWTTKNGQILHDWTLSNYKALINSSVYWGVLKQTVFNSLIIVGTSLVLGYPIAYFLSFKITNLRNQIALFIVALAPFWTSALIRAVAWRDPLMGRGGAVNSILQQIGLADEPISSLSFSNFSVVLAMIQLYVLFMIAPLFFMLAQADRSAVEAARDLGASWF